MVKATIKALDKKLISEYAIELGRKINISKIILFGSAAHGQAKKDSDLDLIILSNNFKNMSFIRRLQLLSHARKGLARRVPMDILGYTPAEAKQLARTTTMFKDMFRFGKLVWS